MKPSVQKKATIKDVAAAAGVSHPTASRILNGSLENYPLREETIQRVREAAERLNYRPNRFAQTLKTRRSYLIGLSVGAMTPFRTILQEPPPSNALTVPRTHPQSWGDLTFAATLAGWQAGYQTVMMERAESKSDKFERQELFAGMVDGVLYLMPTRKHPEYLEMALAGDKIVLVGDCPPEVPIPSCDISNRKTMRQLTEHVIERGARRIAYVFKESPQYILSVERLKGFHEALEAAGLTSIPSLELLGERPPQEVRVWLEEKLRKDPSIDAVVFADYNSGRIVLEAAGAAGRNVPGNLLVAGICDGWPREPEELGLTCIHVPMTEMAYQATRMLVDLIEGRSLSVTHVEIPAVLQVRRTTGGPAPVNGAAG